MTADEELAAIAQKERANADRLAELAENLPPHLVGVALFARREIQVVARRLSNLARLLGTTRRTP